METLEIVQDIMLMLWKERERLIEKRLALRQDMNATIRENVRNEAKIDELCAVDMLILDYFDKFGFSDDKKFAKISKERRDKEQNAGIR